MYRKQKCRACNSSNNVCSVTHACFIIRAWLSWIRRIVYCLLRHTRGNTVMVTMIIVPIAPRISCNSRCRFSITYQFRSSFIVFNGYRSVHFSRENSQQMNRRNWWSLIVIRDEQYCRRKRSVSFRSGLTSSWCRIPLSSFAFSNLDVLTECNPKASRVGVDCPICIRDNVLVEVNLTLVPAQRPRVGEFRVEIVFGKRSTMFRVAESEITNPVRRVSDIIINRAIIVSCQSCLMY